MKETIQKILSPDAPKEALGNLTKEMKSQGWRLVSMKTQAITITFERDAPDPPPVKPQDSPREKAIARIMGSRLDGWFKLEQIHLVLFADPSRAEGIANSACAQAEKPPAPPTSTATSQLQLDLGDGCPKGPWPDPPRGHWAGQPQTPATPEDTSGENQTNAVKATPAPDEVGVRDLLTRHAKMPTNQP